MMKQTLSTLWTPGTFFGPASYLRTMTKLVILAVLVLPSAVIAAGISGGGLRLDGAGLNGSNTGLCARIGVQSPAGPGMLRRDVRFQLCTPDGQPLNQHLNLELVVEPLTAAFSQGIIGIQSVSTDSQGRFSFSYGGSALPDHAAAQELHTFLLDGQVIATFVLERGPEGLNFSRAPEGMARCSTEGESEARTRSCQAARLARRPALSEPSAVADGSRCCPANEPTHLLPQAVLTTHHSRIGSARFCKTTRDLGRILIL